MSLSKTSKTISKSAHKTIARATKTGGQALERLSDALPDAGKLKALGGQVSDEVVTRAEQGLAAAKQGARSATRATRKFATENPAATAGALVGVGLLVGAVAHAVAKREPTLGEVLGKTLSRGASGVSKAVERATRNGAKAAARGLRRAGA
jgi:ElaB/YqjD/DUF883 family membrane-anchored ribosome-binding protein